MGGNSKVSAADGINRRHSRICGRLYIVLPRPATGRSHLGNPVETHIDADGLYDFLVEPVDTGSVTADNSNGYDRTSMKEVLSWPLAGFAATAFAAVLWSVALPSPAVSHADLLERIRYLDGQIMAAPEDARLYLKRAKLHREHMNWPAALADVAQARRLAPKLNEADFREAQIRFDKGEIARARGLLDRYLDREPQSADGRVLRAKALKALDERAGAIQDLDFAITRMSRPSPDLYLERARILRSMGPSEADRLLRGLAEALDRLGPVVVLVDLAINVEVARNRAKAALAWLDRLPKKLLATLKWQVRRGDILAAAGRGDEARRVYARALKEIEAMPVGRRSRPTSRTMETRLRRLLAQTE